MIFEIIILRMINSDAKGKASLFLSPKTQACSYYYIFSNFEWCIKFKFVLILQLLSVMF